MNMNSRIYILAIALMTGVGAIGAKHAAKQQRRKD